MLAREVLRMIAEGGPLSRREIANRLGIQESTLDGILSLLSSKGYLRGADNAGEAAAGCTACPLSGVCARKAPAYGVYTITEKGRNYLEGVEGLPAGPGDFGRA